MTAPEFGVDHLEHSLGVSSALECGRFRMRSLVLRRRFGLILWM